jgi:hypothetical protein
MMSPETKEIVIEGLRHGLVNQVAKVWTNVTGVTEIASGTRFAEGLERAVDYYERALRYVREDI